MATKLLYLIFLFSTSVFTQGEILEKAINFIQDFAESTSNDKENLLILADTGKNAIKQKFETLKMQANEHAAINIMKAKTFAEQNKANCLPDVQYHLDNLQLTVEDRWDECLHFSQSIIKFTQFIHHIVQNFEPIEELFCNGIQTISACEGDFLQKWHCVTEEIKNFINQIYEEKGDFGKFIKEANDLILDIIANAMVCFGSAKTKLVNDIQEIINTRCNVTSDALQMQD